MRSRPRLAGLLASAAILPVMIAAAPAASSARAGLAACAVPKVGYAARPHGSSLNLKVYITSNPCRELVRAQIYCETLTL